MNNPGIVGPEKSGKSFGFHEGTAKPSSRGLDNTQKFYEHRTIGGTYQPARGAGTLSAKNNQQKSDLSWVTNWQKTQQTGGYRDYTSTIKTTKNTRAH